MTWQSVPLARLSALLLASASLGGGPGCAHAGKASARRASEPAPQRVLVTGSRMPRPVSRTGLPVADFAVKIYPWRAPPEAR